VRFFPQILLFDVWRTISKDDEVYSIVIHWFLKASGFFLLEVVGCWKLFDNLLMIKFFVRLHGDKTYNSFVTKHKIKNPNIKHIIVFFFFFFNLMIVFKAKQLKGKERKTYIFIRRR
jgi:hypothetical protein